MKCCACAASQPASHSDLHMQPRLAAQEYSVCRQPDSTSSSESFAVSPPQMHLKSVACSERLRRCPSEMHVE